MKFKFSKMAQQGAPVWIRVPGTPFTLPGAPTRYERLPGMSEWAPRDVVERMGKGLSQDVPAEYLAERESQKGLPGSLIGGGIAGGTGGALVGRLAGGEAVTAPVKDLLSGGITKRTLRGLKDVPRVGKVAPLVGAGLGLLGGASLWSGTKGVRRQQAKEVARGLLSEQILQQSALQQASSNPVLRGLDIESASAPSPLVVMPGYTGV